MVFLWVFEKVDEFSEVFEGFLASSYRAESSFFFWYSPGILAFVLQFPDDNECNEPTCHPTPDWYRRDGKGEHAQYCPKKP
jgi:hypothetical protein